MEMNTGMSHPELGGTFAHTGVAEAYQHRPPYPPEVFDLLTQLITDQPRVVLDLGAGDGAIARTLAPRVERVDALDISAAMVEAGRTRPGGDHPNIRWIVGPAETTELHGPYALVTAGASLHWMQWDQTMTRLADALTPNGQLVIIGHGPQNVPWQDELVEVIKRHSRNPDYSPRFSLTDALEERGLYQITGHTETAPTTFRQTIRDYTEEFHSTATLARELMSEREAQEFDQAIEQIVRPHASDDTLELTIVANLTWGRPQRAS